MVRCWAPYATVGNRLAGRLAMTQPRGWIVDLRQNTGGNMWPMIAAVAGLLDRGILGHFLPDGQRQAWCLNRRHISLGRKPLAASQAARAAGTRPRSRSSSPPVRRAPLKRPWLPSRRRSGRGPSAPRPPG